RAARNVDGEIRGHGAGHSPVNPLFRVRRARSNSDYRHRSRYSGAALAQKGLCRFATALEAAAALLVLALRLAFSLGLRRVVRAGRNVVNFLNLCGPANLSSVAKFSADRALESGRAAPVLGRGAGVFWVVWLDHSGGADRVLCRNDELVTMNFL